MVNLIILSFPSQSFLEESSNVAIQDRYNNFPVFHWFCIHMISKISTLLYSKHAYADRFQQHPTFQLIISQDWSSFAYRFHNYDKAIILQKWEYMHVFSLGNLRYELYMLRSQYHCSMRNGRIKYIDWRSSCKDLLNI